MVFKLRCVQRFGIFLLKTLVLFSNAKWFHLSWVDESACFFIDASLQTEFRNQSVHDFIDIDKLCRGEKLLSDSQSFWSIVPFQSNIKHFCCFKKSKSLFLFQILREILRKNCNFVFFKMLFCAGRKQIHFARH